MAARIFSYFLWGAFALIPALLLVLPWFLLLPYLLAVLWMLRRGKRSEILLLVMSLCITIAAMELMIRMMADDLFYREHERFARHGCYLGNIDTEVPVAHGDMVAMDPRAAHLAKPHRVQFQTDSDGFRNAKDYSNEPYILLGDSFVAGVGHSAPDTLVAQINALKPGSVYSLGYPGEPNDYQNRALEFLRTHPKNDAKFIWFIYEGNDLAVPDDKTKPDAPMSAIKRLTANLSVRELPLLTPRYLTILYKRIGAMMKPKVNASPVIIQKIGTQEMAFYQPYIDVLKRGALKLNLAENETLLKQTVCVFVIPDKSRVYSDEKQAPASIKAVEDFFAPHHIPVKDLGPAMQLAAIDALKHGEFIYWADDTHWNAKGIAVAAMESLSCMKKLPPP